MKMEKPQKTVTLKDIAQKAGFSINTISRALKDKPDISAQTRENIQRLAAEMGYIGNAAASAMRSGVSRTVAVIVGDISNPHFAIMIKEIEAQLRKLHYTVLILNTDEEAVVEKQAIVTALNQGVDGILICPTPDGTENIRFLMETQVPFVLIGRRLPSISCSYVVCDDEKSGYLATRHLLEQGHRRILFLNGTAHISSSQERLRGYRTAFARAKIPVREELIYHVKTTTGKGQNRIFHLLKEHPDCTAVLAFSDLLAWEVLEGLERLGRRVPEDCSVVGFDNVQSKFAFPVAMTTVSSSKITMATQAVEVLLGRMQGETNTPCGIVLDTKLIKRKTVKAV